MDKPCRQCPRVARRLPMPCWAMTSGHVRFCELVALGRAEYVELLCRGRGEPGGGEGRPGPPLKPDPPTRAEVEARRARKLRLRLGERAPEVSPGRR